MKEHGQSGLRTHAPDRPDQRDTHIKSHLRELNVATYNVRTLNDTTSESSHNIGHKLQQIAVGCDKHQIDIVALQEHRLTTIEGDYDTQTLGGWTLAHTSSSHKCHGTAILFNERIDKFLINIERKSDRIIAAHLRGNPRMCVISAYAPTEVSKDESKNVFYNDLHDLISTLPPHTVIIVAGDFNARIGKDSHETNARIVGPNCYHDATNDNGQRMIDLCEANNLRPAHSHFINRRSCLATYHPPNPEFPPTQIDHILINTKWWKSIKDCRAFNTIDIASDHKVVTARFRLSLRATKRPPNDRCKFNSEKLANPDVRATFDLDLSNHFASLLDEATLPKRSVQEQIQLRSDALDRALIESSHAILGKRQRHNQPHWVSATTISLIDEQEGAKKEHKRLPTSASKVRWQDLQKQVTAAMQHDEQAHLDAQIQQLELASNKREYGTVWKIIGNISGPPTKPVKVRKLDGSLPVHGDEIIAEWRSYFQQLLNNRSPIASAAERPPPTPAHQDITTAEITSLRGNPVPKAQQIAWTRLRHDSRSPQRRRRIYRHTAPPNLQVGLRIMPCTFTVDI